MNRNKRYAIVGIFEDYAHRRPTSTAELGCYGLHPIKEQLMAAFAPLKLQTIRDPYCALPSMWAWGIQDKGLSLSYLYTQLAYEWSYAQQGSDTVTLHSVLDIYTELVLYHRRLKWLEPVIAHAVEDYDLLVYLPDASNRDVALATKYDRRLRFLMRLFKGNYVQANTTEHAFQLVRDHVQNQS